jgi:alpha-glucosidase
LAHTADGFEISASGFSLRVDALRPDILRVRLYPLGHPVEDASWAVLPGARTAHIAVTQDLEGFSTSALRVRVSPDLRLTVTDLAGNILQQDAIPVSFEGSSFRVSKQKSPEDHFFGLGDKPGPLDRAGESFVMWNTDNFGWQESTDPLYKSIPFFLDMHSGRALGVLFDNTFRTFFDFGHERTDRYTFSAPAGPLDYYLMWPGAKTGCRGVRLAHGPFTPASNVGARLSAVALYLYPSNSRGRGCGTFTSRSHSSRRFMARHRFPIQGSTIYGRSRSLPKLSRPYS